MMTAKTVSDQAMRDAFASSGGNGTKAAALVGMSRSTFCRRAKTLNLRRTVRRERVQCVVCGAWFEKYLSAHRRVTCGNSACTSVAISRSVRTHGESRTKLHKAWCWMKSRCSRKANKWMKALYHDRGIDVCQEWQDSYEEFRQWAMSHGYSDGLELDRRDNNLGYSPSNCRWATRAQQMQNTRKRRNATTSRFKGVSFRASRNHWVAQIGHSGKRYFIGSYKTEIEAARAYDKKALSIFGEFACTNDTQGGGKCS